MTAFNPTDTIEQINDRIEAACARSGRDATEVALIGASKTVPPARLRPFLEAGLRHAGENYCQEGVAKIDALNAEGGMPSGVTWHFIGGLQSNKAKDAVRYFDCIHSVDRLSLAAALDKSAWARGKVQRVLLQVNVSAEDSKSGCAPEALGALVEAVAELENLHVDGLMALPAYETDAEKVRPSFAALRELRDRWVPGGALSMGMSNDFEAAIEEGATFVRLGSILFGARK